MTANNDKTFDNLLKPTNNSEKDGEEEPFVNKGLERWEKVRAQWLSQPSGVGAISTPKLRENSCIPCTKRSQKQSNNNNANNPSSSAGSNSGGSSSRNSTSTTRTNDGAENLNVKEVIDLIVSNRWRVTTMTKSESAKNKAKFPNPVSLPQMVDILVDLWEAEGLDV